MSDLQWLHDTLKMSLSGRLPRLMTLTAISCSLRPSIVSDLYPLPIAELLCRASLMTWATQAADVAVIIGAAQRQRLDVIRHCRCGDDAFGLAIPAQRLIHQPPLALLYSAPPSEPFDPFSRARPIMRRAAGHRGDPFDVAMHSGWNRLAAASIT